jgi:MoaA/NifB/PqqE/SkfB family radical SAM enzyme
MILQDRNAWKFAREMAASNYRSARMPYRLLFYLTLRCNCRCRNCLIWKRRPGQEITLEEIQRILAGAAHHLRWLHLSGGEIFLREDIAEIFKSVTALLPELFLLQIATNCTLPDRVLEACRILERSRVSRTVITLSIDAIGPEHDRQRGVPGLFDRVIGLLKTIRKECSPRIRPYLGLTITRSNADKLPETVRELTAIPGIGREDIHYNFYHQSKMYYQNDDSEVLTLEQAVRLERFLRPGSGLHCGLSPESLLEQQFRKRYLDYLKTGQSPMLCEAFAGSLSIDSSGNCFPCMSYPRSAGLIRDYGYRLDRLWNSEAVRKIRDSIVARRCPQCWTPCEAFPTMLTHCLPGHKP